MATTPAPSVVDNMNRTENPLSDGGQWSTGTVGSTTTGLKDDGAKSIRQDPSGTFGRNGSKWSKVFNSSGVIIEWGCTVANAGSDGEIDVILANSSKNGYGIAVTVGSFGTSHDIVRYDAGVTSASLASFARALTATDKVLIQIDGNDVVAWHDVGSGYVEIMRVTDSTYRSGLQGQFEIAGFADGSSAAVDDVALRALNLLTLAPSSATSPSIASLVFKMKALSVSSATSAVLATLKLKVRTLVATVATAGGVQMPVWMGTLPGGARLTKLVSKNVSTSNSSTASLSRSARIIKALTQAQAATVATSLGVRTKVLTVTQAQGASLVRAVARAFSIVATTAASVSRSVRVTKTTTQGQTATLAPTRSTTFVLTVAVSAVAKPVMWFHRALRFVAATVGSLVLGSPPGDDGLYPGGFPGATTYPTRDTSINGPLSLATVTNLPLNPAEYQ